MYIFFLFFYGMGAGFAQQNLPDTISTKIYLEKILFVHLDTVSCFQLKTARDGHFNFAYDCHKGSDKLVRYHVGEKNGIKLVENIKYINTGRKDTLFGRFNNLSLVDDFMFSFIQNRLDVGRYVPQEEVERKVRLTFPVSEEDSIYDYCVVDFMDYADSARIFCYFGQSENENGLLYTRSDSVVLNNREHKKLTKFLNKIRPVVVPCKSDLNSWLYEISENGKKSVYYVLSDYCAMDSRSRDYKYKYRLYHYLRYLCSDHFDWYPQDDNYY